MKYIEYALEAMGKGIADKQSEINHLQYNNNSLKEENERLKQQIKKLEGDIIDLEIDMCSCDCKGDEK